MKFCKTAVTAVLVGMAMVAGSLTACDAPAKPTTSTSSASTSSVTAPDGPTIAASIAATDRTAAAKSFAETMKWYQGKPALAAKDMNLSRKTLFHVLANGKGITHQGCIARPGAQNLWTADAGFRWCLRSMRNKYGKVFFQALPLKPGATRITLVDRTSVSLVDDTVHATWFIGTHIYYDSSTVAIYNSETGKAYQFAPKDPSKLTITTVVATKDGVVSEADFARIVELYRSFVLAYAG